MGVEAGVREAPDVADRLDLRPPQQGQEVRKWAVRMSDRMNWVGHG
jgi:hypothetical protein